MMNYGVITEVGKAEVWQRPIPVIGDNDILVRLHTCNICTADYNVFNGKRKKELPLAGGHENAGVIVDKGKSVNSEFTIGDHVGFTIPFCGVCMDCRAGNTMYCRHIIDALKPTEDGIRGFIGFAEYKTVNARIAVKVSPALPFAQAGFLEPLATVVHGLKRLNPTRFDTTVVIGAGTMGLLNAQAARFFGAKVIVTEILPKKIEVAKSLGLDVINAAQSDPVTAVKERTNGNGADIVICAVGSTIANTQAMEMIKDNDGKILYFAASYPAPDIRADSNIIHYKALNLVGTYDASISDFMEAAKILNCNGVDVGSLIEASFPLGKIQKAFEAASTPGSYRVSVTLL
ncbi:MAG: zinc-binding dehydrogenase [Oscillospiraceae bacterium]|nr:zinc-binding dehydrogenase [Oscillospiraceae bacterium]